MKPHPDYAGRPVFPRSADLGAFHLSPLGPDAAEEDFAAVTRSAPVLRGLFQSDWPDGLTLAENRIDLAWHEREFTLGRSFSWILRDAEGGYLGCAYVFPDPGTRGRGVINFWLADSPARLVDLRRFQPILAAWLAERLPKGADYLWQINDVPDPA